jgi:hypothetical protein
MHIEFLVEEESCEAALTELVPRILPGVPFRIHAHGGKSDLLRKLPARLRAYGAFVPPDWRIVILADADVRARCKELKHHIEDLAVSAGLSTKSQVGARGTYQVLVRLAVEELEAWFLGDPEALRSVYPRLPATLEKRARYRDPDAVPGGTWEALERVLRRSGYHKAGLPKTLVARAIAMHMDPCRNRSRSFQVFRDGLRAMVELGR